MKTLVPGYLYVVQNPEELIIAVRESNCREGHAWLDVHDDQCFMSDYTRRAPQSEIQYPALIAMDHHESEIFSHIHIVHSPLQEIC